MLFQRGYFCGSEYTYGVYLEHFPARLHLLSLLQQHRPFRLDQPFRLLELGCGQGVGLALQAALHPAAGFCGIDLLPQHVRHGQALANAAGLGNVSFRQADLVDLVSAEAAWRPGVQDLVIGHGLLSWVSPEVQQAIWQLSQQSLRPGGLCVLTYNSFPGKLGEVPVQHLVQALQHRCSDEATGMNAALGILKRLQSVEAGLFRNIAGLGPTLDHLLEQDHRYLFHEFSHQNWQTFLPIK